MLFGQWTYPMSRFFVMVTVLFAGCDTKDSARLDRSIDELQRHFARQPPRDFRDEAGNRTLAIVKQLSVGDLDTPRIAAATVVGRDPARPCMVMWWIERVPSVDEVEFTGPKGETVLIRIPEAAIAENAALAKSTVVYHLMLAVEDNPSMATIVTRKEDWQMRLIRKGQPVTPFHRPFFWKEPGSQ